MALVNMTNLLQDAFKNGYAVGNFDVFNTTMLRGVLGAAQKKKAPVILAYAEAFEPFIRLEHFAEVAIAMAKDASVPVVLHLDHAGNFPIVERALKSGFTSIMMDASALPLAENIRTTQEVVKACRAAGASAEAELGHVGGLEGQYEASDDECVYTEVEEAKQFVAQTGVDALAVAIGTVHGVYKNEPKLNLQRLQELKDALHLPLVLHGGSGLSDADFQACIRGGIAKINIFTDLTIAANDCMAQDAASNIAYIEKCIHVADAVQAVAAARMDVFGTANRA